ncbi:MAG: hypothetical protein ACD_67C00056G0002 [uncultured bacterium]|nr:MAG: hypothetical protein ACD_67C00056G0002 [uncultured bacterium]
MVATKMVATAKGGCHLNGIKCLPQWIFKTEMLAVKIKSRYVKIPRYIIRGLPKMSVYANVVIIFIDCAFSTRNHLTLQAFLRDKIINLHLNNRPSPQKLQSFFHGIKSIKNAEK